MEETVADETPQRSERREHPEDLKEKRSRHREAAHEHHHTPSARGILTGKEFRKHENRQQKTHRDQKI
ncbi:MAG: hypothetical protein J6T06_08035, partial [Victivallales bacterium]|nr:hypothetical protein [Victivallales bacterium]